MTGIENNVKNVHGLNFILIIAIISSDLFEAQGHQCAPHARYRRFNGSCNNLNHPTWGRASTAQRRFTDAKGQPMVDYADDNNLPRGYPKSLPSPRILSNGISAKSQGPKDQFDRRLSGEHMAFGQIITHDVIETEIPMDINCCNVSDPRHNDINICFPFDVPIGDKRFPSGCKNFVRASRAKNDVKLPEHREQINLITSYIDASFLYGISDEQSENLRVKYSYLLKTDPGDLLPTTDGGSCLKIELTDRCPFAGDNRSSESPNLGLNHLLFVREHNRIAKALHLINPHWNSETVFQETRIIVIAMIQHIAYNHFLPTILDKYTMRKYHLFSKKVGFANAYHDTVDASITNGFGVAPFRYGHSQIMPEQSLLSDDLKTVIVNKIEDNFLSPNLWQKNHGQNIPDFARWLAMKPAMKVDRFVEDGPRDKLFFRRIPFGTDLVSLNIQRGRDQGVPGYNKWRELCNLIKLKSFKEFGKYKDILEFNYSCVDDIDFFIGGLIESGKDGTLGPTFKCVIGKQFERFKIGDRFWYETDDRDIAFSAEQLSTIKKNSLLSKIFCRNFDINEIQHDIFLIPNDANPIQRCNDLPDLDLSLWKSTKDVDYWQSPADDNYFDYYRKYV